MHDWILLSISVDWKLGTVNLVFRDTLSLESVIVANEFVELAVPRKKEWGMSASVNSVCGPTLNANGYLKVAVEMQSGDCIEIVAASIEMPIRREEREGEA